MTEPELKMEQFDDIIKIVGELRDLEVKTEQLQDIVDETKKALRKLGIICYNTTNCVVVGKLCFKCKNNQARRSYFRNLLQKDSPVLAAYAENASSFKDIGGE